MLIKLLTKLKFCKEPGKTKTTNRLSKEYAADLENQIEFLKMSIESNVELIGKNNIKNPVHPNYRQYHQHILIHEEYAKETNKEINKLIIQLRALKHYLELPND